MSTVKPVTTSTPPHKARISVEKSASANRSAMSFRRLPWRGITYSLSAALLAGVGLIIVMRAWGMDPRVAINDGGDCLFVQVLAKAVAHGWWFHIPNLAAPFGLDLVDAGIACTVDFICFKVIGLFTSEPGLIVNLYWLVSVMLTAASALLCLRRMGVGDGVAFVIAVLFALSPWTFWRNTSHVLLPLYLVPPVVLFCCRVLTGDWEREGSGFKYTILTAVFLTGFLHTYIPFFVAFLLAAVTALRAAQTRFDASARAGAVALIVLVVATGLNLAPTLVYRAREGSLPEQKQINEAEIYGLKMRHLITPVDEHVFPPFRWMSDKLIQAGFPHENENRLSQLGTTATAGFLILLAYSLYIVVTQTNERRWAADLRPLSFVVLFMLLLGMVGGIGTLFNVFITPGFRAYTRVSMFISFASFAAVGLVVTRLFAKSLRRRVVAIFLLPLWVVCGVVDQIPGHRRILTAQYESSRNTFGVMREMVRNVESVLSPGDAVFQLPHTEFIHERRRGDMNTYEHARAYLHSNQLRFSWGALSGRNSNWASTVAEYPPDTMLDALVHVGFAGIWIDTLGFSDRAASLNAYLIEQTGRAPMTSSNGRYMFYDIRPLRRALLTRATAAEIEAKRQEILFPVQVVWTDGFYPEEPWGKGTFRWSRLESTLELRNPQDRRRRVTLAMSTKALVGAPLEVTVNGVSQVFHVGTAESPFALPVEVGPRSTASIAFRFGGPAVPVAGDPREFGFMAIAPTVTDTSLHADVGTAVSRIQQPANQPNLAANGSFEGGGLRPWEVYMKVSSTLSRDTVHSGTYSLQQSNATGSVYQDVWNLQAGVTYNVSAWVYGMPSTTATAQIAVYDSSTNVATFSSALKPQPDWQVIYHSFKLAAPGKARIHLFRNEGAGTVLWDDVIVTRAN